LGIVIKQSIRSASIAYIGVAIGYVNLLWLFPTYMSPDQVGLFRLVQVSATLLATFGVLGLPHTTIRFFPEFNKEKGFFSFIRLAGLVGFLLLLCLALIFKGSIVDFFSEKSALFIEYYNITLLLSLFMVQFQIMEAYSRSHLKTVVPVFVRDVQLRVLISIIVILFGLNLISFDWMLSSLVFLYASQVLSLTWYFGRQKILRSNLNFQFLKGKNFQKFARYGLYSLLGAGGTQIVLLIDSLMVSGYMGLDSNGVYSIGFFIGVVIEMPKRSILQVVSPLISQAFQKKDMPHVATLYKQASINQFIIGSLLLLGIWINLENIYAFIPNGEEYLAGMGVVLFIGLGKLSDMLFGPNGEIIIMSKYYGFNVVIISFLAVITIVLNDLLIPEYGLEGAAIASFIAMLAFNVIKWGFVIVRFKMQPFTWKTLVCAVIVLTVAYINQWIPVLENKLLDIILRSAIVSLLVLVPTYALKLSPEMNGVANRLISKKK